MEERQEQGGKEKGAWMDEKARYLSIASKSVEWTKKEGAQGNQLHGSVRICQNLSDAVHSGLIMSGVRHLRSQSAKAGLRLACVNAVRIMLCGPS